MKSDSNLAKTLTPMSIWGLGVGLVISGMYFGWNLGLPAGGTYGMLLATILVTIMYGAFVCCYAELACAMPFAGGAYIYAKETLGPSAGYLAGIAQLIEFIFAPPAIAAAIGGYFSLFVPAVSPMTTAILIYAVFTAINIYGIKLSARIELVFASIAVIELLIFLGVTAPHFTIESFSKNPWPNGFSGTFAAIPFAIWFYLGIEGLANVAEEAQNPRRDISRGFFYSMATLIFLAFTVFACAIGVDGWESIVFVQGSTETSDSPLPLALSKIAGSNRILYDSMVTIGLFGLLASFHGIILAAGRATMEFGREGLAPRFFGRTLKKRKTPAAALIVNMCIGIAALYTGRTADIITLAVFGALTLYIISLFAYFSLRVGKVRFHRPYIAPLFPLLPAIALIIAVICIIALFVYNLKIAAVYASIIAVSSGYYFVSKMGLRDEPRKEFRNY